MSDALKTQVDGDHYKKQKIQPIELAYLIGATPCFTKLAKYMTRDKGDRNINLDKAIHCVNIEKEIHETAMYHILDSYPLLANPARLGQAEMLINIFSEDPFVQAALKAMIRQDYDEAIAEVEALKRLLNVKHE
jgi:hypothetical protein